MTSENKLLDIIKQAQGKLRLKKDLKIFTKINIVLIAVVVVILIVFLMDVFTVGHKAPKIELDLEEEVDLLPRSPMVDKAADSYIAKENIPLPKEEVPNHLSVLGIIRGDKDQVVIEDKETNTTFFLYTGNTIGDFRIFDIKDGAVILDHKGKKVQLNI
ncbi:MAG: hypothetical protein V3S13_03450 [Candidatus Omnitrophota bacterium]